MEGDFVNRELLTHSQMSRSRWTAHGVTTRQGAGGERHVAGAADCWRESGVISCVVSRRLSKVRTQPPLGLAMHVVSRGEVEGFSRGGI